MQLERNLAWRGSRRLLRGAVVTIGTESQKRGGHGRRYFTGGHNGERRPEKRCVRILTSEMPMHSYNNATLAPLT